VSQAEAALELARAERRQTQSDLKRARELRQKDVLSEQGFEQIETQFAVARAREQQAEAALVIARESLAKTRIFAPYAGTVAKRLADEGTTARAMPQTIVIELQETGDLEAVAALPESVHARVHVGDRALLTVEGLPDAVETRVMSVADTIDSMTRTFLVRMRVPNPDHRIKAGVFARVEILSDSQVDTLLIPRDAVRSEVGRTSVLVVRDGKALEIPVRLGIVSEDAIEVLSGIDEGQEVIVGEEARGLAPGISVSPRPATGRPRR
jgi:RND family efflux transporter MFP subunit